MVNNIFDMIRCETSHVFFMCEYIVLDDVKFVLYINYYNKNYDVYKVEKHVLEKKEAVDKDGKESKSTVINIFNKGDIWQIDYYHTEFGEPDYIEEIKE